MQKSVEQKYMQKFGVMGCQVLFFICSCVGSISSVSALIYQPSRWCISHYSTTSWWKRCHFGHETCFKSGNYPKWMLLHFLLACIYCSSYHLVQQLWSRKKSLDLAGDSIRNFDAIWVIAAHILVCCLRPVLVYSTWRPILIDTVDNLKNLSLVLFSNSVAWVCWKGTEKEKESWEWTHAFDDWTLHFSDITCMRPYFL